MRYLQRVQNTAPATSPRTLLQQEQLVSRNSFRASPPPTRALSIRMRDPLLAVARTPEFAALHCNSEGDGLGLSPNRDTYTALLVASAKLSDGTTAMQVFDRY